MVAAACACLAALGATLVLHLVGSVEEALSASFRHRVEGLKPVMNAAIADVMARGRLDEVAETLEEARSDDDLVYLVLRDANDRPVAAAGRDPSTPPELPSSSVFGGGGLFHGFMLVEFQGRKIGTLHYGLSTTRIEELRRSLIAQGALITAFAVLVAAAIAAFFALRMGARLAAVSQASRRVAEGDYSLALDEAGPAEVAQLAASMNRMSSAVRAHVQQLEQSEARLRLALAAGEVVTWECDTSTHDLSWGPGAERVLGAGIEPSEGYPAVREALERDVRRRLEEVYLATVVLQAEFRMEVPLRRPDGGERWVALRGKVLPAVDGCPPRLIGVARDVTDGKLAEQRARQYSEELERRVAERTRELESAVRALKAANRELESFSYSISHDLRAPLRTISGMAGILREDHGAVLERGALDYLDRIDAAARRLGRMVDDLLDFSRTGRIQVRTERVDMNALVRDALAHLPDELRERAEVDVGELPEVSGDPSLLAQVWQNLLGNAAKFSRASAAPRIEVSGRRGEAHCEYRVRDNGVGFEQAHASRLFGVFERLHREDEFEGTGVGLAIVHRIVTRHGGSIAASGWPGRGAEFRFVLPATPPGGDATRG